MKSRRIRYVAVVALLILASPAFASGDFGTSGTDGLVSVLRNAMCGLGVYMAAASPPAAIGVAIGCLLMVLDP